MFSSSCIKLITLAFESVEGVNFSKITLGEAQVEFDSERIQRDQIIERLETLGFSTIKDPNVEIMEKTKVAAIELIHKSFNANSLIRNSEYISDKLQLPYDKISRVFSQVTGVRLEKYIILLKIEKAKEMLASNDYTVSEIAYMLDYSSVQYFSNQFKKTVGVTVSQFKSAPQKYRIPLDQLI